MPVSNPSYFPSVRNIDRIVGLNAGLEQTGNRVFLAGFEAGQYTDSSDMVVIGSSALNGLTALTAGTDTLEGAIVIGSTCAQSLYTVSTNSATVADDAPIVIGFNTLPNVISADGSVIIGANSLRTPTADNAAPFGGVNTSVVIGDSIYSGGGAATDQQMRTTVMIGYGIGYAQRWNSAAESVIIGSNIGNNGTSSASNTTVIGSQACLNGYSPGCTVVGALAMKNQNTPSADNNTVIGYQAGGNLEASSGGTYLGYNAGSGFTDTGDGLVIAAGGVAGIVGLYNLGGSGGFNLAFGAIANFNQVSLASSVNTYFFANGTKASANPTGGGYFYVTGGILHWVDSSGIDTQISLSASGELASTSVGYTNNAGAAAGTLTNAPAAGNPTKWIPINDNGTIRNIPAW
jgi:hypothetical protein